MIMNWPALRNGCLILAGVAFTSLPTLAQTQEPAGATATASVISSVAITQGAERSSVRVEGEGRLDARTLRMQNPDRLVLDFAGTRLAVQKTMIPGVAAPVRGVRLGQYRPDIVRVVIDLSETTPYQISRDGNALVVFFDAQPAVPASLSAGKAVSEGGRVPTSFRYNAVAPRAVSNNSKNLKISAPGFALPSELTQPSVVLASYNEKREPARPDGNAAQQAAQQANSAASTMAASTGQQMTAAPAKYTGEPISVNLKDVDLRDFFRLIHEISGLNVVLDPAVKGTLTIVLDEVPWDQALDIVLLNNGLDKQLNGNVLRIATHETLKHEAESVRDLEKAQSDAIPPVTFTRVLSYSKASSLTNTLKRFLTSRGEILADERSNQLIIRDIPSVIPVIDNLLHQLDRKSQQVEIEARVVSASRSFSQDIGTQLGFAGTTTHGRSAFSGDSSVGSSNVSTGPGLPQPPVVGSSGSGGSSNSLPLAVNLGAGVPTSGVFFGHRSPNFAIDLFITAAEARGVGKLLSKPRVVTQNNEKAVVKQGTKVPIQTTINNTISITFIDAVLKLEVTPQITADGTVFMDVLVENTQIDQGIPRVQGTPALDTQSAETKVLVEDGGTVVIGGIIISQQRVDITQVPIVGSLPVIGRLFKRTDINIQSQELLFFLTPRIIPG
ncbi:MAG TPA: type IV pilus secretin PilQ [Candidatus Dormibacteraeota bacterium]|jgi:type IV pilus assembly protein PilQ|nr:type IV pilus secretin PilQ [Candidatus Dormibacteraeota bacterium]